MSGSVRANTDPLAGRAREAMRCLFGHDLCRKTGSHFCGIMHLFRPQKGRRGQPKGWSVYIWQPLGRPRAVIFWLRSAHLPDLARQPPLPSPIRVAKACHFHLKRIACRSSAFSPSSSQACARQRRGALKRPGGGTGFPDRALRRRTCDLRIPANRWVVAAKPLSAGSLHPPQGWPIFANRPRPCGFLRHRNPFPNVGEPVSSPASLTGKERARL